MLNITGDEGSALPCYFGIIHNGRGGEQAKWPVMDKWVETMEYYLDLKKRGTLPFATMWMNLEDIILGGISQTQKDK